MIHLLISDIIITHSLTKSKQIIDLERLFFLFKDAVYNFATPQWIYIIIHKNRLKHALLSHFILIHNE